MNAGPSFDRLIWLHLRDTGGWSDRREIADELDLTTRERLRLTWALHRLQMNGHIVHRDDPAGLRRWGVTARCDPPDGLSLQPSLEADTDT